MPYLQPPLPGMGRDAIKSKKKKAKQLSLPGIDAERVKPKGQEQEPLQEEKPKLDKLRSELASGNRPMFMTPSEIAKNVNLGDAGTSYNASIDENKKKWHKELESKLLNKKLGESKRNSEEYAHRRARGSQGRTLYNSIKEEGLKGVFKIHETTSPQNKVYLHIGDQHHRLASLRNLNPNQFIPVRFGKRDLNDI